MIDLNRRALGELRCEKRMEIVAGGRRICSKSRERWRRWRNWRANGLVRTFSLSFFPLYRQRDGDFGRVEDRSWRALARRGRKVRTPEGAMPRNSATRWRQIHAGRTSKGVLTESATENKPPRPQGGGKGEKGEVKAHRLPSNGQGHGKPHRVQGQIGNRGAARSGCACGGQVSGTGPLRQMMLSLRLRRADRIRLTARPKSLSST